MYCYILSSRLFTKKLYKFGKTVLVREELIKCYRRYIPDVEILEFYPSSNHHKDETRVLTKFREYRYVNHDGHVTEWLDMEFSKLKSHCDKFFAKSIAKLVKKESVEKIDVEKELSELDSSEYDISLEKACYILNKNDIYIKYIGDLDFRENFIGENLNNCEFIINDSDEYEMPWFTLDGFRKLCVLIECKESNVVKKYYEKIEKQNKIDDMVFEKDCDYLIPIKNNNDLVNKIIKEYNPKIKEITVYGNNEFPLFVPSQIRDILQIKHTTFDNIMNTLGENTDFIYQNYMQIYYTKNKITKRMQLSKKLLTKYGLYKILIKNNREVSKELYMLLNPY